MVDIRRRPHLVVQHCFNAVIRLKARGLDGEVARQVHALLQESLGRLLKTPQTFAFNEQQGSDVAYALAALADETAMRHGEAIASFWQPRLLQVALFFEHNAGEQFFVRMDKILDRPENAAVVEAYATALALGFEGSLGQSDPESTRLRSRFSQRAQNALVRRQIDDLDDNVGRDERAAPAGYASLFGGDELLARGGSQGQAGSASLAQRVLKMQAWRLIGGLALFLLGLNVVMGALLRNRARNVAEECRLTQNKQPVAKTSSGHHAPY